MKNEFYFEEVAKERINKMGGDLEKTLDIITGMVFAGVHPSRVYAFAKTGQHSKARATQEFHDAVHEFYTIVKGH